MVILWKLLWKCLNVYVCVCVRVCVCVCVYVYVYMCVRVIICKRKHLTYFPCCLTNDRPPCATPCIF